MHREFLKLLEKATGRSEHVIALNLDIRGFTPFCHSVNPLDVATYIKKVYLTILNNYFKSTSYYKPTGDGLIIIIPFTEKKLKKVANSTVDSCFDLLQNFASLLARDPMINYPTPQKIGIGLTRGSACRISSKDKSEVKILDYSGGILNLASRLMDLARPSGIVLDDSFGIDLFKDETRRLFLEDTVYIRGVAEEKPTKIYYSKKHTLIPESYHHPIKEPKWNIDKYEYTLDTLENLRSPLTPDLTEKPSDPNKIRVVFSFDVPRFTQWLEYSVDSKEITYLPRGFADTLLIDLGPVCKSLRKVGATKNKKITIKVIFPVK